MQMNNAATTDANGQKQETPASAVASGGRREEPREGKVKHGRREGGKAVMGGVGGYNYSPVVAGFSSSSFFQSK